VSQSTVVRGTLDEGVHCRGATAAGVGAGEQIILPADRDAAQGTLGRVIVEREPAIIEATVSAAQRARM
jgi:hypothetical protein